MDSVARGILGSQLDEAERQLRSALVAIRNRVGRLDDKTGPTDWINLGGDVA